MKRFKLYVLCLCCAVQGWCGVASTHPVPVDTVGFVTASLVVASPGEKAYSVLGHAALRMQCPEHGLDFCFSYELPEVGLGLFGFMAGTLNYGMIYASTEDYRVRYKEEGRTVTEYMLNLTDEEKRRLWRLLDERVADGLAMPCKYLHHGCAVECVRLVDAVLVNEEMRYDELPKCIADGASVRGIIKEALQPFPWEYFLWTFIAGTEVDAALPVARRLIVPDDVSVAWSKAVIVDSEGKERPLVIGSNVLCEGKAVPCAGWNRLSWVVLLWLAVVVLLTVLQLRGYTCSWGKAVDAVMWGFQTLMGMLQVYLWLFSGQDATSWNWYLVVFNPVPFFVWGWGHFRRPWSTSSCAVIYGTGALVLWLFLAVSPWLWSVWSAEWTGIVAAMAIRTTCYYIKERERSNINNQLNKKL